MDRNEYSLKDDWSDKSHLYYTNTIEDYVVNDSSIPFKYSEHRLLEEIREYIEKTYDEHYAISGKGIQTTEFIIDNGHGVGFTVGNIIKYAQRYGKKEGRNRKDIMKVIHYAIMLLHIHDLETKENS